MKIAVIESSSAGVNYHRLTNPLSYVKGHDITLYNTIPLDKVDEVEADVLIFSRYMIEPHQAETLAKFKARGTKIILDVDDHWSLPNNHIMKQAYIKNEIAMRSVEAIRWADVVWVTHQRLADEVRRCGANRVKIYPNALDPTDEQWQPRKEKSSKTRIGFTGGSTHEHDLYETEKAWKIAHCTHDNFEAVLCGVNEDAYEIYDKYHYILSGGGKGKVRAFQQLDVHNYATFYDHMDVSIAPLVDCSFNRFKSNLKIVESGMKATPIICSWMHPYMDESVGIYKTDNWRKAFAKMLRKSKAQLEDEGQRLREYVVKNYDIRNHKREL